MLLYQLKLLIFTFSISHFTAHLSQLTTPSGQCGDLQERYMSFQYLILDRLLNTARSVRKRLGFFKAVDIVLVAECSELAMHAPSS